MPASRAYAQAASPVPSLANPVINGGFDIWQRGTSISGVAGDTKYTVDRFNMYASTNQASTISRQATSDTTNLPNLQYCARYQRNSGQTGTADGYGLFTSIETANSIPFAGKTVTVSAYIRKGANFSATSDALTLRLYTGTGTDQNIATAGFTGMAFSSTICTLTTTWQRFVIQATIPATATEIAIGAFYGPTGTAGANDYFEITGLQIDLGTYTASTAPAFRRSGGTLAGELAACQRYYYRVTTPTSNYGFMGLSGGQTSTSTGLQASRNPVTMRTEPTSIEYSSLSVSDFTNTDAITSLTINSDRTNADITVVDSGNSAATLGNGKASYIRANNSSSAYFGVSAEL